MSVVKNKRNKSKVEFEMVYFQLAEGIDVLVEHQFFAEGLLAQKNRVFLEIRSKTLEKYTDDLLYHIKIANSIYPTCLAEYDERRLSIGKAIGVCHAILTVLQRIMMRLRVSDDRYTLDIHNIMRMINSLKAWRKSDNRLKSSFS